ncbi:hypothetical protein BOTBODRAFT_54002 [Botryobasidium botryosum FD-172 SS1]|uniref:Cytochrome P450 n=1 Tax=Botryobasidium botryosum (strain FD-172 SS1) TaxID=930990 RepID=A0A067MXC8_BOTB1|nr:hypothetical protein BOTBODRAFT_54002 [Botryobasidium botryosum FD-172 SS1]
MALLSIVLPLGVIVWFFFKIARVGRRESDLPPGPPTVPFFGNLLTFPKTSAHYKLTEWAKEYGEIYSLKLGPGTAIVLTGAGPVKELMDKRSGSTIDRPPSHMADVITGGMNMVMSRYTENWRLLRKAAHTILTPQACTKHLPIQQAEAIQLLFDILKRPDGFYTHVRRYSSSFIFSVLFGVRSPKYEGGRVAQFFTSQHEWEHALETGAHPPMDLIPILKKVPERWAPWKTLCKKVRTLQRDLYFGLLKECEHRIANGLRNDCFMEGVLDRQKEFGMSRELVGYLGGVLIEGGSDTTSSFLQTLILAMVMYPDARKKAQEELDRVVGQDRMPTPDDIHNLPYIRAMINETHRWRPVAPLAIPHATVTEEIYNGYRIPAGSTIFVNAWGIFHDENVYEDHDRFWPDRYIKSEFGTKEGVDDSDRRINFAFGSGRRICPGIHLAFNSLTINTMNLLWAFNFDKATDPKTGKPIDCDIWGYAKGILTGPKPFQCSITPRSPHHAELIEQAFYTSTEVFLPFEGDMTEEEKKYAAAMRVHT